MSDDNSSDVLFAPYARAFETFALAHNLLIEKYSHEVPVWSFCFAHPRGGQAKLDVFIHDSGDMILHSAWWIDSYAQFTRSLKWGVRVELPRSSDVAVAVLRNELSTVMGWQEGDWTRVADGYQPIWGQYSEAQFRAMTPNWPTPRL